MHARTVALRLQQTASSLTLLTLLAMVPVASIALLGLTALPSLAHVRRSLERFLADQLFLPSFSETVLRHLNTFAAAAERLSAIGTVAFFATAVMTMLTIDRTLNGIWRAARPRPLRHRLALYWALLSLGPVLIGGALALQFKVVAGLRGFEGPVALLGVAEVAARLGPIVLLLVVLTLVYRLVPNATVRWRDAGLGALTAVLLLLVLKQGLMVYIAWVPTYTLVYGAFSVLPLFLLWVFALWLSVLWGAVLAAHVGERSRDVAIDVRPDQPGRWFECLVEVLVAVLKAPSHRLDAAHFKAVLGNKAWLAERAVSTLAELGYLVRVVPVERLAADHDVWDESWLAAPGLEAMNLLPLFERLWGGAACRASGAESARESWSIGGEALTRPVADWARLAQSSRCKGASLDEK